VLFLAAGPMTGLGSGPGKIRAFSLVGDRMTVRAEGAMLQELLSRFAECGVRVQWDPILDRPVWVDVTNELIEAALGRVLETNGFTLVWEVLEGPAGRMPRLAELRVYRVREPEETVSLGGEFRFDVVQAEGFPPYVAHELVVGLKPGTTVAQFEDLLRRFGATATGVSRLVGVYRLRLPDDADVVEVARQMAGEDIVAAVEPDWVVSLPPGESEELPAEVDVSGNAGGPDTETGKGRLRGDAVVAVLDSGLKTLDALQGVVVAAVNALDPSQPVTDPVGHGTQMALLATGRVAPEGYGVEPGEVPVVAVQAFDRAGNTSLFTILQALEFALSKGARVVSMSWGTEVRSEFLEAAVSEAQRRGLVLVAAAGNRPTGRPIYPAAFRGVVGVSAIDSDGTVWRDSNFGAWVDVSAPGSALLPVGYGGGPGRYAGTSISCAVVAHALARFMAGHPELGRAEALERFLGCLTDAGEPGRDAWYGVGKLDASAWGRLISSGESTRAR